MEKDNDEMMKLFDFILENKNIIIADNKLFSRDTLIMMRAIAKGKIPNDFQLTREQKQLIIDSFINSNSIFTEDTPSFIIENEKCDRVAIARDLNSINFIKKFTPDLRKYVISEALKNGLILTKNSPDFLKINYNVALNSIKFYVSSANFVNWDLMKDDEAEKLIGEAIKHGYVLSSDSPIFLKENIKIVFGSIKKNKETIQYAGINSKSHPEVFKYLILNGYRYNRSYLKSRPLNQVLDSDVLCSCFEQLDVYRNYNEEYIARFNKIFSDAIKSYPYIHTFQSVFETIAEAVWQNNRENNINDYENIFGKICAELRNCDDFERSLRYLSFLSNMESTLGIKYDDMYNAMKEYFNIFHSNTTNKLEKIQPHQDIISKLSALYVSKCKESFKKEQLENYYYWLTDFFTLRMDHPIVDKMVIQRKQREIFRNLYLDGDQNVCNYLNDIVKSYREYANDEIILEMIKSFVLCKGSKISHVFIAPFGYYNYERYEKALKLINRLNSGYIKYDGVEVNNYKDIIKYDETIKKYVYSGITFNDDDLNAYNEFRKKAKLFDKIKRDIMVKVRTMEVGDEIDNDVLDKLAMKLPFTDEYFVFDKTCLGWFNLDDLCRVIMPSGHDKLEIESFIDDQSFANLYNLLIKNGVFWLQLFMSEFYHPKLREYGISRNSIVDLINNMKNISDLSKEFIFDTTKYDELLVLNDISKCADAQAIAILGKENIEKLYKFKAYTGGDSELIISMAKEFVCQMVKRNKSTVPYVNGETMNYKYSVYDPQDDSVLLAGINTDACFRIDGNDNDFFHYCSLDKNGLVIKITDNFGNFIARAGGFRNGNCVFFNQLRTIYDEGGNNYCGNLINEQKDIIEAFQKACEDIVSTSQQNSFEKDKIDHVFVTHSYSLADYDLIVPDDVTEQIGDVPMDNYSEDWEDFIENTKNLQEAEDDGYFTTDYGDYCLICMASSKKIGSLIPQDIKPKNVEAVYERKRNHIIATNKSDVTIYAKVNKINGIKSYLDSQKFKSVLIPEGATVFTGDNWYIIYYDGNITNSCVLDFDKKAVVEFEEAKKVLLQYTLSKEKQKINIEQVSKFINEQNSEELEEHVKMLKMHC